MHLASFRVRGFRSLRDVALPALGRFNVFYGPNGSGKSNLLAAIALGCRATSAYFSQQNDELLRPEDLWDGPGPRPEAVEIDMAISTSGGPVVSVGSLEFATLAWSVRVSFSKSGSIHVDMPSLEGVTGPGERFPFVLEVLPWDHHLTNAQRDPTRAPIPESALQAVGATLRFNVESRLFRLVPATRAGARDRGTDARRNDDPHRDLIADLLSQGRFSEALVRAQTSPDPAVRAGFRRLREVMSKPPLSRPSFDPVHDPLTGTFDLQEVDEVDGRPRARSLTLEGLGIQQIYVILAQLLLGGTDAAGIEEPEAHLHAPTSGLHLRALLRTLVDQGYLQQLFVATHSNLFDLDPTGWWEVSRGPDGATQVRRQKDWSEMHRQHLYEPGPARFALLDQLRHLPPETTVVPATVDET
jgi:energy-coupling factor transporter ATP-binding protein EcfA2